MILVSSILAGLAGISFAIGIWQWVVGRRFPIRQKTKFAGFRPAISVLKPLKGCDAETEVCLESWLTQKYAGEVEFLFGVASPNDPVCELVRRLIVKHSTVRAQLVIAEPVLGANAKVSTLCHLTKRARHEHLVVSDADVFVLPVFFGEVLAALREEHVGIVNCFYIQASTHTLPMRMEAVAGNSDFWTHVLQAVALKPMDFALGAALALRKSDLAKIGGFEAIVDYLADDFEVGKRIAGIEKKLRLCTTPVECRSAAYGWRDAWQHQVRWARTIRVCRPVAYFFSILGNGTLWPLLAFFTTTMPIRWLFMAMLFARMLAAVSNYKRLTQRAPWWVAPIALLQDIGQAIVWFVSFLGNRVVWRGEEFRVQKSGKLTRVA
ncbi:MAG TPA: glycosyltransferase [Verrucomicrobiae bacterium]